MTTASLAGVVHVQTDGPVTRAEAEYARTKVVAALHHARDPILFVRLKLAKQADPSVARPALVQVNVSLNGRMLRAQVARPSLREASDEAHDRIRDLLQDAAGDWEAIRGGRQTSQPHQWRHGDAPTARQGFALRPVEERQIVRRKSFTLDRMTVDQAVVDMEMLGYDFHLFTEDGSGTDSVLYRASDGASYRLGQLDPSPDQVTPASTAVTVSAHRAPVLLVDQAVERLNVTGWPFVFFRDAETDRGCVLYHRYDGHYGLITPSS